MVDRVQAQKWESSDQGGQDDEPLPCEIDINEDGLDARAHFIQNDTSNDSDVVVSRDSSDNMTFADKNVSGTKTLADLVAGGTAFDPDDILTSRNTGQTLVSRNEGNVVMHR